MQLAGNRLGCASRFLEERQGGEQVVVAKAPAQKAGDSAKRAEQGDAFVDRFEQLVEEDVTPM